MKTNVFNLIILDASDSMMSIACNEFKVEEANFNFFADDDESSQEQ